MKVVAAFVLACLSTSAVAQSHGHSPQDRHAPYAGLEKRQIKSLSDEQITDLRAGRGMSLALAAELNGYPGPSHVLELADALGLTPAQRERTESMFGEMQRAAAALGARLVDSERRLDTLFASGSATAETLATATAEAASLQGELRALHLRYHVEMKQMLSQQQVAQYETLRGYRTAHAH